MSAASKTSVPTEVLYCAEICSLCTDEPKILEQKIWLRNRADKNFLVAIFYFLDIWVVNFSLVVYEKMFNEYVFKFFR